MVVSQKTKNVCKKMSNQLQALVYRHTDQLIKFLLDEVLMGKINTCSQPLQPICDIFLTFDWRITSAATRVYIFHRYEKYMLLIISTSFQAIILKHGESVFALNIRVC